MKQLLLIFSFTLGLTTVAQAGYVASKSSWESLSYEVQIGYAMGAFDELITVFTDDGAQDRNRKLEFRECASRLKLTAKDLVEIINTEYKDLAYWQFGPSLMKGLCTVCYPACKK